MYFKYIRSFAKSGSRIRRHKSIVESSVLFDPEYYLNNYRLPKRTDAAWHFCSVGWRKGFNPSEYFDVKFYSDTYKDVRLLGVNPLIHYITDGGKELRRPRQDFDVQAFHAAHPEHSRENAAEACVARYGTYAWQDMRNIAIALPADILEAFRPHFDENFYRSMNRDVLNFENDYYAHFVRHGQHEDRDPAPDFDIDAYRRQISDNPGFFANPIYHYVKIGSRHGLKTLPESSVVLDFSQIESHAKQTLRLCVHAHCFYPELISELLPRLRLFPSGTQFVLTVVREADRSFLEHVCKRESFTESVDIRLVPNKGRDLGPLIVACRDLWWENDVILHVHTKKSPHISWGDDWRIYLLDQLIGSRELINSVINSFETQSDLGCFFPRNFCRIRRFLRAEHNEVSVAAILAKLGYGLSKRAFRNFPAGSMAWYRTEPLRPLVEQFGSLDCFEDEAHQIDETFAHALERALPFAMAAAGYRVLDYMTTVRASPAPLNGLPEREASFASVPARWQRDTPRIARDAPKSLAPLCGAYNPRSLEIHWITPSFGRGAGGHMTIFRIVEFLERFGHRQTLWLQNAEGFDDQAEAKRRIQQWYRPIGDRVHVRFLPEDVRELSGDVLIATDCWTAFPAAQARNFKERFYFVQDYEPSFHPAGEMQLVAESTYDFGFPTLCAGTWLEGLMRSRGLWARAWDLCADHEVYHPGPRQAIEHSSQDVRVVRIAFYARPYTPRRAVALGFAAFEELNRRGARFHVDLFGEADLRDDLAFPHTQHGVLSPQDLADLYREADLGVVFSTTNYSLIPLEMMACDLPVVEIDTPSTRAIFTNGEVSFAKQASYQIADTIEGLILDPDRRAQQVRQGRRFVDRTSWEASARTVETAILDRLREKEFHPVDVDGMVAPALLHPAKATVFIPTYNAGPAFERVLDAVTRQNCDFAYDVYIIDSESSDGTPERAQRFSDRSVRVESIPKAEFQHGRTRNLGIDRSDGQYVAVITQDACPANERWLANLIAGFSRGPKVAGVIGRHEAYPEHDAFTHRDMTEMFDGLALLPAVIDRDVGLPSYIYPGGRTWRMLMQFYSDNNSAMRREAWKIFPYPEVDWGEDQVWADEMLRLGFQKAYADDAVVYHSHAFDMNVHYKTSVTEGRFWGNYFGYDLHPEAKDAITAMNDRDRAYAIRTGVDAKLLKRRELINRATVEGRTAGYRASRTDVRRSAASG